MIEKTLVLVKPDGVQRGLIGDIVKRFEQRGLKIVGMKMVWVDKKFAEKHYTEDIEKRRGKRVREMLLDLLVEGPVVAMAVEGIHAIEVVRKIVGDTEPLKALPGTIRGDFAHHSFDFCNEKDIVVRNLIHASSNNEDAKNELALWFKASELHSYHRAEERHVIV